MKASHLSIKGIYGKIFDKEGNLVKDKFPLFNKVINDGEYFATHNMYLFPDGNFVCSYRLWPESKFFVQGFNRDGNTVSDVIEPKVGNDIAPSNDLFVVDKSGNGQLSIPFDLSLKSAEEELYKKNVDPNFVLKISPPFGIKLGYEQNHHKFIFNEDREQFYPSDSRLFLVNDKKLDGAVMISTKSNKYDLQSYDKNGLRVNQFDIVGSQKTFTPLLNQGKFIVFNQNSSQAQIFDKNGPRTDQFKVVSQDNVSSEGNIISFHSMANLPNGDFVIVSQESASNGQSIGYYYGQVFNSNGQPISNVVKAGDIAGSDNDPYIKPWSNLFEINLKGKNYYSDAANGVVSNWLIYDKNDVIFEPKDFSALKSRSRGIIPSGNDFPIYLQQCKVEDFSKLPSIKLINSKPIDNTIKQISMIDGDNNIIEITSAKAKFDVNGFNGIGGANDNDKFDFSLLTENEEENAIRLRFLQTANDNISKLGTKSIYLDLTT
jgi:hypothetical protein